MKSIVWLASYPKSGNTWLRLLLANYIYNPDRPLSINLAHNLGVGDSITRMYAAVAAAPFNPEDSAQCFARRHVVLRHVVSNGADVNFVKTHHANAQFRGEALIPQALTRSAIVVVRNPLDVVISFASHYGTSLDAAINIMGADDYINPGRGSYTAQFFGSWSQNIKSWSAPLPCAVLRLRYEDMLEDAARELRRVVEHVGLPFEQARLERAVAHSGFDTLRRLEEATGFIENSANQPSFFRVGRRDQWREVLTPAQVGAVRERHGEVMEQLGYGVS